MKVKTIAMYKADDTVIIEEERENEFKALGYTKRPSKGKKQESGTPPEDKPLMDAEAPPAATRAQTGAV